MEDWTVEEETPGAIHVATLSLSLANNLTFATTSAFEVNVFVGKNLKWHMLVTVLIGIKF